MSTTLYRMYDHTDTLLYVGITTNVERRIDKHRKRSFWDSVERVELQHFDARLDALDAETLAIATEQPVFNLSRPHVVPQFPNGTVEFIDCKVCGRQNVDDRDEGDDRMTECSRCMDALIEAHAAGAQWASNQEKEGTHGPH